MRLLVIGAGLVGSVIVRDLVRFYSDIDEVIVGDIDVNRVDTLAKSFDKVSGVYLDVMDGAALREYLRGVDCVVNATYYGLARYVLDAALDTGTPYLDLGSSLYNYDKAFKERSLTALIDVGGAPGLINMLAKYLVERFDEVNYIHLYDVNREIRGPFKKVPIRWKYSVETMLDESIMDAVVYRGGRFIKVPPFSEVEERCFPEPIGCAKVFLIFHPEVMTLAETYADKGIDEVWYKIDAFNLPWDEGMKWKLIADLGLASNDAVNLDGYEVVPRKVLLKLLRSLNLSFDGWAGYEMLQAVVSGVLRGTKLIGVATAVAEVDSDTGSLLTAVPASIASYLLAKGVINVPGAHPIERIMDTRLFFDEVLRRGIKLSFEFSPSH